MSDDTTGFVLVPRVLSDWMRGEGMRAHMAALYVGKKSVNEGIEDGLKAVDLMWPALLAAAERAAAHLAASPEQPASEAVEDREALKDVGFWRGLDHIANFINALDTYEMSGKEVRTAIYAECLSARPRLGTTANEQVGGGERSTRVDGEAEKPVAWRWEGRDRAGYWTRNITAYKPDCKDEGDQYCRNVEPLYLALAHPAESANCPVGGEEIKAVQLDGLSRTLNYDIARSGSTESFMIRTGLLRDILDELAVRRALPPAGAGDVGALTEAQFVSALSDALVVAYRRAGGITRIARLANGAAVIRNIATLEAAAIYREALSARKDAQ